MSMHVPISLLSKLLRLGLARPQNYLRQLQHTTVFDYSTQMQPEQVVSS